MSSERNGAAGRGGKDLDRWAVEAAERSAP